MKKINFADLTDQQLVDIRSQQAFQEGHLKGALNLNPGNFKKFARYYLNSDLPVVFISENSEELTTISHSFEDASYLDIADIPSDKLEKVNTISATDFLKEEDFILLDVRHPDEITRPAPEKNLVNIPFDELITAYQTLDSTKKVYTLCGSGNRGTAAASLLLNKGYTPIVITGGMKAMQEVL